MSLSAVKPLERIIAECEGEHSLKKTLGPVQLVALGIGAIIGAGLFSLTGIAAANHAGPAVTLSFILAATGCAFAGLCYSEFSTMIPVAGSAYTYSYATMGELMAWIIGWDLFLEYAVGATTVAVSWSRYVVSLLHDFGIDLPAALVNSPFALNPDGTNAGGMINLPAILVVLAVVIAAILGFGAASPSLVLMVLAAVLWNGAFGGVPSIYQACAVRADATSPELAGAWVNATANLGIGGGAAIGAGLLPVIGLAGLPWVSALLICLGLAVATAARRAFPATT